MYRPIEMEVVGSGTRLRDLYADNRRVFDQTLTVIRRELSFWEGHENIERLLLNFYADWYANPVSTILNDAKENPAVCLCENMTDALTMNLSRLKAVYEVYTSIEENGQNSTEEYEFGKQKQTSKKGERTDTSIFGERGDSVDEYTYPMAGYSQGVKPDASTKSKQEGSTDTTTYGSSTDTLEQDGHTNTVTRKDSDPKTLKTLADMTPFTRTVLDVFRDCFTLSEFGVW